MKLTAFLALTLSFATLGFDVAVAEALPDPPAPAPSESKRDVLSGSLLPRAAAGLTLCTGPNFGGQCKNYVPNTDSCYSVPDPYKTDLSSARTSSGYVCMLYTNPGCSGCEACVDSEGWGDMGSFADVQSLRCVVADAAGCSNANCAHH